ncbi:mitogen-activated protein kinase kinase kinase 13 [Trichonephila clavata]|uniref:Mitogen-activated protein kinase kinase kinase 13 n=1 Tax=Trichonephila clavata TaxID=2740835 RepID=A0A8X6JFH1_TRICU|nr:mitogen-activated protein kinase kinase kinase 13 [Trichonephila clavata]
MAGATSIKTVSQVLEARGFHLRKWHSNSPDVLSCIFSNWVLDTSNLEIHPDECSKALGLTWNSVKDTFIFNLKVNFPDNITKHSFLSQSARLYDPLGFLTPCTVSIKIFYQQLWLLKLDWDSPLPDALATKWKTFQKYTATASKQLMGDLPAHRVTPSRPFSACGVDYAGPINVLRYRGKGAKTTEGYIALFATWKKEIGSYMQKIKNDACYGLHVEEDLIKRRKEELKHAQDIREHYEKKLERANNLYMELATCLLQVEQREQELIQREHNLMFGNSYARSSRKNIRRFLKNHKYGKKRNMKYVATENVTSKNAEGSAFHGSAKSRIRRAKYVRNDNQTEKFNYSVPFDNFEIPFQCSHIEQPNLIDTQTQTESINKDELIINPVGKQVFECVENLQLSYDFAATENSIFHSHTPSGLSLYNSSSHFSCFVKKDRLVADLKMKENVDNFISNRTSFKCQNSCEVLASVPVDVSNCSEKFENVSFRKKITKKKPRLNQQFCRMGSFRGKLLLKKFGSSLQEFSNTEESCESDYDRDSTRHSRFSLSNISENSLSSSDEYYSEENTSEHSSSQYTAAELLSSMSNPDITLNAEFDSSCAENIPVNQNSRETDGAQNLTIKVVDAGVMSEQIL